MANCRVPGSIGNENSRGSTFSTFHPCSATETNQRVGSINGTGLTPEQEAVALDIVQITLDIVGIFEPTPFADGTNAIISIGRGDWLGAALSGISIIPYIGDLAKAGKLPRYGQKLYDAIELARRDSEFARYLRPALENLKKVIDSIPDNLSPKLNKMVDQIKRPLDSYLGAAKVGHKLSLLERLVIARLGSVRNVGTKVWDNIQVAQDYFVRHGIPEDKMIDALNGIDVHSPVEILQLSRGDKLSTSMVLPGGKKLADLTPAEIQNLAPGQWFVKTGGGVGKESVGLAHGSRQTVHFEVTQSASVLKSKAASVDDSWTNSMQMKEGLPSLPGGPGTKQQPWTKLEVDPYTGQVKIKPAVDKQGKKLVDEDGKLRASLAVGTRGGGTQYFFPKSAQKGSNGLRIKVVTRAVKYGTQDRDN